MQQGTIVKIKAPVEMPTETYNVMAEESSLGGSDADIKAIEQAFQLVAPKY